MALTMLKDAVQARIEDEDRKGRPLFDEAVLDAMRLADQFEQVKPEEYVLPLDAMAGFKVIPDRGV